MNKVAIMGRLTADPEVNQTTTGVTAARYTLAVPGRPKKDSTPQTDFIRCVAFGKAAEFAEKYLAKGTKIAVVGRIQTGSYEKSDGTKVYTTDIVIEEQEFCESKNASAPERPAPVASDYSKQDFMQMPGDFEQELPFR